MRVCNSLTKKCIIIRRIILIIIILVLIEIRSDVVVHVMITVKQLGQEEILQRPLEGKKERKIRDQY